MPSPVRLADAGRRLLIVSADDYALTDKVSRSILNAHRRGVVTSTSVLALTPSFDRCARWLSDEPRLGVGAHLAAVGEDPPLLSAAEIPTLVDRRGRLRSSWRQMVPLLAGRRIDPGDLRREFGAQLERLISAGVTVDHLDTHQDLHRSPIVNKVLLDLAIRNGIGAVRVCRVSTHSLGGVAERRLARGFERRCRERGIAYPEGTTGAERPGQLDLPAVIRALHRLASTRATSAELVTHPGPADDLDRARYPWGYRWDEELAALTSGTVGHAVKEYGFVLGTFRDLVASPAGRARRPPAEAAG